jgi:hypothetical protein
MIFPFVSRSELKAAEARAAWAEQQLRLMEQRLIAKEEQLAAERGVQEKLLDRIAQMSGQPPIFEKPGPQLVSPLQPQSDAPAVPTKVMIDDIHKTIQQEMKSPNFKAGRGRI